MDQFGEIPDRVRDDRASSQKPILDKSGESYKKKAEPLTLPLMFKNESAIYFRSFFLPYPASPINPHPRRSMVAGSGTPGGGRFGR